MLNIVDVFSGAGGLTEGFRYKDYYNFIYHIEMDKDACSSLELRNIYYYLKKKITYLHILIIFKVKSRELICTRLYQVS